MHPYCGSLSCHICHPPTRILEFLMTPKDFPTTHSLSPEPVPSTVLRADEALKARKVMNNLPGMAMQVNANVQAQTVDGLLAVLMTTGTELQYLHDRLAKAEQDAADLVTLRRILAGS